MTIYFLRHGEAEQAPSLDDRERPLSEFGKQQAGAVAEFMHSSKIQVDLIFSSPFARAIQTAEIVRNAMQVQNLEPSEYLVPGTRKNQLLDLLNSSDANSVLLVGHEPHLSQTVSLLLTEHETLPIEFKKCALACVVSSEQIRKGHAVLQWFLTCQQMEMLSR